MKIGIILMWLLAGCFSLFGQEMPDWVKERPVSSLYYVGIGRSLKTDKDYMQTAKQNALKDLASELKVQVSSHSLLNTLESEDGKINSRFEETVKVSVCEEMEKYHLAGTWQNDKEYWVYYELSIIDYEEYIEKRKRDAVNRGYDFWKKGVEALDEGYLVTALELWAQGMEAVKAVMNEELVCSHEGKNMDVACELYAAIKNVFAGTELRADSSRISVQAYSPVVNGVGLTLTRGGEPLKQVALDACFLSGDGKIGNALRTDESGRAVLHIENVSSIQPRQEIGIKIDVSVFKGVMKGAFSSLFEQVLASAPQTVVRLEVTGESMRVYICGSPETEPAVMRAVKEICGRNRFVMVDAPVQADAVAEVTATCRKGEKQRAGVSVMVAWYATVEVVLTKREGGVTLLEYAPQEVRILQPESVPEQTARRAVVAEVVKRLNRQLPGRMKEVYQ